ncbi:uncharacterized protein LOC110020846 isoform X2 [Phalaenopsis equestris]|uniref:uncharacterized protein LOC110020846 isoform X2 n=1 Tax=Phalaenopsis equestris TaxID=78828 RepID=UPI0009E4448F|nr:uncharacterized protein LOC110020846 isoform X2 [Phalaenopsis equestris]
MGMVARASVLTEAAVVLICFGLWFAGALPAAAGELEQRLSVGKHLRRLNKPSVKSIQSSDGDIIDCVKIADQPAFDHPFLKNHTIQLRPAFHPEGLYDERKVASDQSNNGAHSIAQLWHQSGRCPKGTVPIRRTRREDILRASSVKRYGKKKQRSVPRPFLAEPDFISEGGHQHAIAYVNGDKYYGAKAIINVWEPNIQLPNEFSLSQLWILGGSFGEDLNSIEAGWLVSPELYGDNNTRLFIYWTDPKEGNWWMQFGSDNIMGYWPSFLFSYLSDSASTVEWGGEVINSEPDGRHTATHMGSGHFPEEGFGKASYFKKLQIVDASNNLSPPRSISTFTEQSNCYDVQYDSNGDWGSYFYFGGPGRNPNCQ